MQKNGFCCLNVENKECVCSVGSSVSWISNLTTFFGSEVCTSRGAAVWGAGEKHGSHHKVLVGGFIPLSCWLFSQGGQGLQRRFGTALVQLLLPGLRAGDQDVRWLLISSLAPSPCWKFAIGAAPRRDKERGASQGCCSICWLWCRSRAAAPGLRPSSAQPGWEPPARRAAWERLKRAVLPHSRKRWINRK